MYIESNRYQLFVKDSFLRRTGKEEEGQSVGSGNEKIIAEVSSLAHVPQSNEPDWLDLYNVRPYKQVTVKELRCSSPTFTTAG